MSFDIFFLPCRFGGSSNGSNNSRTAKEESSAPNSPLTIRELEAVRAVLKQANARGPDEHGCYSIEFQDGGDAEVYGEHLNRSCMVATRSMTPQLLQFLIALLIAGNWIMIPTIEDNIAIAPSAECITGVPEDFPRIIICTDAAELGTLLSQGFRA